MIELNQYLFLTISFTACFKFCLFFYKFSSEFNAIWAIIEKMTSFRFKNVLCFGVRS